MDTSTASDVQGARRPLASLLSKSEKAQQRLAPGTWHHTMLGDSVKALRVALTLMDSSSSVAGSFTRADLLEALNALASLVAKTCEAQSKFSPGTSQHTLLRNRLGALRVAEALVYAGVGADAEPGAAADGGGR